MGGIGDDVDVVLAVGAGGQSGFQRCAVTCARGQADGIGVHQCPERIGFARIALRQIEAAAVKHRIRAEIDRIDPALGTRPHGCAIIHHAPANRRFFTREVLGQGADGGHAQVGARAPDKRRGGLDIVGFRQFADRAIAAEVAEWRVGLDHHVAPGDRGRQGDGLADGIFFAVRKRALLPVRTYIPALRRCLKSRGIGDVDRIVPAALEQVAAVLHGVAEGERITGVGLGLRLHVEKHQIGRADTQDVDRPGLVVVVVELIRIVRV